VPNLVAGSSVSFDITVNEASLSIRDGSIIAWADNNGGYNIVAHGPEQAQLYDLALSDGTFVSVWDENETKMLRKIFSLGDNIDNVRGIVFWTGDPTSEDVIMKQECPQCGHGLMLAVQQTANTNWSSNTNSIYDTFQSQEGNSVNPSTSAYLSIAIILASGDVGTDGGSGQWISLKSYDQLNAARGFNNTQVLKAYATSNNTSVDILTALSSYAEQHPAPTNSSGWYIPTFLDIVRWMDCSVNSVDDTSTTIDPSQITTMITILKGLSEAGLAQVAQSFDAYWTSSEIYCPSELSNEPDEFNASAWKASFIDNTYCSFGDSRKNSDWWYCLRPICAF
jgi:hypothetical protein